MNLEHRNNIMQSEFTQKAVEAIKASCNKIRKDIDELEGQLNPKTVEPGDGWYYLRPGDTIQEGDEYQRCGRWFEHDAVGVKYDPGLHFCIRRKVKPATPAVPDGWERVATGEKNSDDYSFWNDTFKCFTKYKDASLKTTTLPVQPSEFVIRPIKKDFDKEWWMKGYIGLNSNGTTFGRENAQAKDIVALRGRVFKSVEAARSYSDWEVKNAGRLRALQQLETSIAELNDSTCGEEDKWYCFYVSRTGKIYIQSHSFPSSQAPSLYFKMDISKQLISEFGEGFIKQALGF